MITEWFIQLGLGIAQWLLEMLPADAAPVPSQVENFDSTVNSFTSGFGGVGVWAPWPFLIFAVGLLVTVWLIGVALKFAAWIWGQIPVIGGSG